MIASRINHITTCALLGFALTGTQAESDSDTKSMASSSMRRPHEVMGSALSQLSATVRCLDSSKPSSVIVI